MHMATMNPCPWILNYWRRVGFAELPSVGWLRRAPLQLLNRPTFSTFQLFNLSTHQPSSTLIFIFPACCPFNKICPRWTGKTMLAKRLPSIIPPLTLEEATEPTKIHSVAQPFHSPKKFSLDITVYCSLMNCLSLTDSNWSFATHSNYNR